MTATLHVPIEPAALRFGPWRLRVLASGSPHAVIIDGLDHDDGEVAPADYANEVLLTEEHRGQFLALIDGVGLVVCRNVGGDDAGHRDVRGRSSKGRLSQGEYYHHDGCSGPTKPRVVEIRCPYQEVARHVSTAVAPFPETLYAMLRELPADLRAEGELASWYGELAEQGALPQLQWDLVQGAINRTVRRAFSAEDARAYFRNVDVRAGAYREPWMMGESRYIANANDGHTMQHRRAYMEVHAGGRPNGKLVKRWPDGPELED